MALSIRDFCNAIDKLQALNRNQMQDPKNREHYVEERAKLYTLLLDDKCERLTAVSE